MTNESVVRSYKYCAAPIFIWRKNMEGPEFVLAILFLFVLPIVISI